MSSASSGMKGDESSPHFTSSVSISVNGEVPDDVHGTDNPAYEPDIPAGAGGERPPSSVTITIPDPPAVNGGNLNGSMVSTGTPPAKDPVVEAVNMEMVNMSYGEKAVDVNGISDIPMKKDPCEDVDLVDPSEQYFVPVNEHRKYIRSASNTLEDIKYNWKI